MSDGKYLTLSTNAKIPQIGLGTWLSKPHEVENAVEIAVRNGYRHLDLAMIYKNQDEVGRALKKVVPSVVKREDLFITSKLWNCSHRPEHVEPELNETLKQLGIDYLDLYLVHWPVAFPHTGQLITISEENPNEVALDLEPSLVDTWKAMIALPIGVSNFSIKHIQGIADATGVWPVVDQIEAHPLLPQDDLVAFCKEHNIHLTAYSPLGNNLAGKLKIVDYPEVQAVATKLGATPAQVLVAWGVYRGYSVIPKSVQESRIKSNFQQVTLSKEDYDTISSIGHNKHTRFNTPITYNTPNDKKWDINIFDEEAEKSATHQIKII
ncbi:hypothetical protein NLI96_g8848 [Meripilus lineatus]|uniref:NADP-dependent oxidoreductase domain-containing protein n=1 Tax=Meripilus lineatus TaxID=2056292 RepID=A0AAD5UWP7_9APHY|nr:hypothetical protein NLI96_g8848 [Physisporinus lineatus]